MHAQVTFSKTIDFTGGNESGVAVLAVADGFIITGTGWGFEEPEFFDNKFKLLKVDFEGNIVWQQVYGDSGVQYFPDWTSIVTTLDGNIAFSANRQTDVSIYPMLIKFDPNTGDTIFTRVYNLEPYLLSSRLKELSDGSFILLFHDDFDLYGSRLIKTDPNGAFLWEKKYGSSTERGALEFDIYMDTIYLVNSYNNCLPDRYWIRKLDADGNVLEESYFSDIGFCPVGALRSNNGGFYGAGVYYPNPPFISFIYKTHANGEMAWKYDTNILDTIYSGYFFPNTPVELPNDDMIIVGFYEPNETSDYRGLVCKVNANGEPYWERAFNSATIPGNYCTLYDVAVLPDQSMLCVGGGYGDDLSEDFNFWLLKLDSMGCLVPGCDTLDNSVLEYTSGQQEIQVFPNPISNEGIVQISTQNNLSLTPISYHVFSLDGKQMLVQYLSAAIVSRDINSVRFPIHVSQLQDGFYMLQVLFEDNNTFEEKIIVTNK